MGGRGRRVRRIEVKLSYLRNLRLTLATGDPIAPKEKEEGREKKKEEMKGGEKEGKVKGMNESINQSNYEGPKAVICSA